MHAWMAKKRSESQISISQTLNYPDIKFWPKNYSQNFIVIFMFVIHICNCAVTVFNFLI